MADQTEDNGYSAAEIRPEFLLQLGIIVARWAALDNELVLILAGLINNFHAASIIYFSLNNFKSRIDIIINLVGELVPKGPERDRLAAALSEINRLSKSRNYLVHSTLGVNIENRVFQIRRRPGTKRPYDQVEITLDGLKVHAEAVAKVGAELMLLGHPRPDLLTKRKRS